MTKSRPAPGDYASYAEQYVSLVTGDDILDALQSQLKQTAILFSGRSERDGNFRYAADKWSVKEVVGHVTDTERIFSYRAMRIARGDQTPLEGFEQDDYVRNARFGERKLSDLVEEYAWTCATLAWRCFAHYKKKPGCAAEPRATTPSRFSLLPTSSRVTNFTIARFLKSATFQRFRAPRFSLYGIHFTSRRRVHR